jgi:hypothetical protein
MPSRTGPGRRRLIVPAAVAAALPLGVAAALYLALPGATPVGAGVPKVSDVPSIADEPEAAATLHACREHPQRVTIDGAPVEAFAVLCREDEAGSWVLGDAPPAVVALEAALATEETASAPEAVPSPPVAAGSTRKIEPRRSATHAHPPGATTARGARLTHRSRSAGRGSVPLQQKYGP